MTVKLFNYKVNSNSSSSLEYQKGSNLDLIGARKMQTIVTGKGTLICIIDTGIDVRHPVFAGKILAGQAFVKGLPPIQFQDDNMHGTHVAGIIIQIAPDAKLLILKALDSAGSGDISNIVKAIDYAVGFQGPNGQVVDLINMSLGCPQGSVEMLEAIKRATARGITICCAAGNEGDGNSNTPEYSYPAMYAETVSVGAIDCNLKKARFSNTNNEVDLAAPGVNIWSTAPGGKYASLSGTSMADPHVTGMAALYIERYGKRFNIRPNRSELCTLMKAMSKDIDVPGIDPDTGAGLVSAWL
jgi:major intracellular serine protease